MLLPVLPEATEMITRYKLKPQQDKFIYGKEQFQGYIGGIATGKSFSLIMRCLRMAEVYPNNLGVIIRKTFRDLQDSTMKDFTAYTGVPIRGERQEVKFPNGSEILFRHGSSSDLQGILRNINLGFFAIEQYEEFEDDSVWNFLCMRLRRNVDYRSGFFIANANGHNHIYNRFIKDGCDLSNCNIEQADTYAFHDVLPEDFIPNLEKNLPKKLFRRYVLNSHEEAEGLVYDEFSEKLHTVESFMIPDIWKSGFVLDHGYRNPTGVLFYAIDFDGTIYLTDEHYEREKPISHHAECIKRKTDSHSGICDPSMVARTQQRGSEVFSLIDEYKDAGIQLSPAVRSKEDASIARVNEFFKSGKIKVFKNCTNAIHEFNNWKWKSPRPGSSENLKEQPEDKDNHLCDGLKYLVASRFGGAEKPTTQPAVYSPAWYRKQHEENKQKSQFYIERPT